ncbi:MAG: GntR family transcriptional regulator [Hyphomicrobiaceae bacterium]
MARSRGLPWLSGATVGPDRPLSEQIYGQLRDAIVTGAIKPDTAVQEPLVAEHFGVSRTPVREALLRLRGDGLVNIKKQSGTFVAPIDPALVEEGMLVREALEPRVAEIAASRLSSRKLSALDHETRAMAVAADEPDGLAFIAADDRFHQILIEAGGFPHIAEIIGRVNAQLDRVRHLSATNRTRARAAVREHRVLIRSLRAGDGARSAELLHLHLQGSWSVIREIVSEKVIDRSARLRETA